MFWTLSVKNPESCLAGFTLSLFDPNQDYFQVTEIKLDVRFCMNIACVLCG